MDSAGRVVIPKPFRDAYGIGPGDTLELDSAGANITLRPLRAGSPLSKEKGVWVFRTGHPLPSSVTDSVLAQLREERDQQPIE